MNKGYMLPIILIILLVILAGFVLFIPSHLENISDTQQETSNQDTTETEFQPNQEEDFPPIILDQADQSPSLETEIEIETSVGTTADTSTQICRDTGECPNGQTCFIMPSGDTGYCF